MSKMNVFILTFFAICCAPVNSIEMMSEIIEDFPNQCSIDIDRKPFVQIGQKYYFIEATKKLNWFAAAHFCRTMDANLVTIDSADEMRFLSQHLEAHHSHRYFWTSGNDLATEGKFEWFGTGKPIVYAKWAHNQPDNNEGDENCVHIYNDGSYDINDMPCTNEQHFICEAHTPKTFSITFL